jgi:hypothetical protein
VDAYVLLAEPGAGKSKAFECEWKADPEGTIYISARDFVTLQPRPEWFHRTLYIDALDEMQASSGSHDGPLDAIRARLDELGRPRFRLSCREADWLGAVGVDRLRAVTRSGDVTVLQLEALESSEIVSLLGAWPERVPDVGEFMREAEQRQLVPLLRNPLLLKLMVDAVRGNLWPKGREETYRLACERLASEYNDSHRIAMRGATLNVNDLLNDSGLLCSVLLLSGRDAYSETSESNCSEIAIDTLPGELGVRDVRAALGSKVFIASGDRRVPRHRTVAEYLAARAIAKRVAQSGLPINRVLALMSIDGGIAESLRGLNAWLAVHCISERNLLIDRDPLGVVLYGDVQSFSVADKNHVLRGLHRDALRFPWFRSGNWQSQPFGALGTAEMQETLERLIADPARDSAHQSLLDCALDAIRHGELMPGIAASLEHVLRDSSYQSVIRVAALKAWLRQSNANIVGAQAFLDDIETGALDDADDELCGLLLRSLYPSQLTPSETLGHLHPPKVDNLIGAYYMFWAREFLECTPDELLPTLVDGLVAYTAKRPITGRAHDFHELVAQALTRALRASGAQESTDRVYRWLGAGLDEYGLARFTDNEGDGLREWLGLHPCVQKAVVEYGFSHIEPAPKDGARHFWQCGERLFRARQPRDWFQWLLRLAAKSKDEALVKYCFEQAAFAAVNPSPDFDVSMEDVEQWIDANSVYWPQAGGWLEMAWSVPLDAWQGDHHRRMREHEIERNQAKSERRRQLLPHLEAVRAGTASPRIMQGIAFAYQERFSDVIGRTPEARIQDFLANGPEEVAGALSGLKSMLLRQDLPDFEEILRLERDGKHHLLRAPCLLAAELIHRDDSSAPLRWDEALVRRMVAFRLTDGTGETPDWFTLLVEHRAALVADVLIQYGLAALRKREGAHWNSLWALAQEGDNRAVARIALPTLLRKFPARANEAQVGFLNECLLYSSAIHLDPNDLSGIVRERLALRDLDPGQRIAWLVAGLGIDPGTSAQVLIEFVGNSQPRAAHLGRALQGQKKFLLDGPSIPIDALSRIIEVLARGSQPDVQDGARWMTAADRSGEVVKRLIGRLAASPEQDAKHELDRLSSAPALQRWGNALEVGRWEHLQAARIAHFRHASADDVVRTIANQSPANALDIAALAIDQMHILEGKLRGDESNGLLLFRRDNRVDARSENDCRDVLLNKLREPLLMHQVQVEREASAAHEKRTDIRLTAIIRGQRVAVPIEIKKDDYRGEETNRGSLWTAWRRQLDELYVVDPSAQGIGIYLVLWFGVKPRPSPEGIRPTSARHLKQLLCERIPDEDHPRLRVVVLDLSLPHPKI